MSPMYETYLVDDIPPQTLDNASATTAWRDAGDADWVTAFVQVGATDITFDAKIEQATDSSGTGAKDVTSAAVTQLTATDDNKYVSIDLEPAKLDIANNFNYVRLSVTAGDGTTGTTCSGLLMLCARHQPPTQPTEYAEQILVAG